MFKEIKTEEEKMLFASFKVKEIKFHLKYASDLGLNDEVVKKYDEKSALKNYAKSGFFQFFLVDSDNIIGIIEFQDCISEIDGVPYIYLKNIYIEEKYRGNGYARKAITNLREEYNKRIELEAWYGIPANKLYESLGMKTIKTRYMLM